MVPGPFWGVGISGTRSFLGEGWVCLGVTAPDWYLDQVFLSIRTRGRPGKVPVGEINRSQTVCMVMVIKQFLGSWSHMWSLCKVSGCGSTSLFGSRAGTHQGK